jgi:hypothetical protein
MTGNQTDSWGYLVAWQFRPKRGAERQFEAAYGPHGVWAKFFMRGEGFIATELNHDLRDPGRYLTLDFCLVRPESLFDAQRQYRDRRPM